MSLLSYNELCELVEQGVIEGVQEGCINAASIDVHLGPELIIEAYCDNRLNVVDIAKRANFASTKINIKGYYYDMRPDEFLLAHTVEKFNLPDNIVAEFYLKSSGARSGLEGSHAGHCDCGWHGSVLTLELKNMLRFHSLRLTEGMPVGQMLFFRVEPVPKDQSYSVRGRYNRDTTTSNVKL